MRTTPFITGLLLALTVAVGGELRAQITFEDLHSTTTPVKTRIRPVEINRAPMQRMAKPSKPSAHMPHFKQHVIRPTPINTSPIQRNNIQRNTIKKDNRQITFNPMVKNNIRPQAIKRTPQFANVVPGQRIEKPVPIQKAHWAFNPSLQGKPPTTIRYDTSIRLPMPDYNSPYHQDIRPPQVAHPIAW